MASHSKYFAPSQMESDQKDLIIAQLKAEIYELTKNEQNCLGVMQQIKSLDHKSQSLEEEKLKYEDDFCYKYENTIREIGKLKSEIDTLHINLKEKNMEFQELKAENVHFSEINEQNNFELNKTLKEISIIKEDSQKYIEENNKMQKFIDGLYEEKKKIMEDINILSNEIDSFDNSNFQLEKKLKLMEEQNNELQNDQNNLIKKNENIDLELAKLEDENEKVGKKINEGENTIKVMVKDINDLDKLNAKMKTDLLQVQKHIQNQIKKTGNVAENIKKYESTFRNKDFEIRELKSENHQFRENNIEISDINLKLSQDLDLIKKNIEMVQQQNSDIIEELNTFYNQDEKIISQLNRKEKFIKLKEEQRIIPKFT